MQVERVKARSNGTAWNGDGPRPLSQGGPSPSSEMSPTSPRSKMPRTPGPLVPSPKTPAGPSTISPIAPGPSAERGGVPVEEAETDFPRRVPVSSSSQTLFDPSVSVSASAPPSALTSGPVESGVSRPNSTLPIDESTLSPEDLIEAKLAAVSLREGVTIGPPASKQNGSGPAPSYARIVKRD